MQSNDRQVQTDTVRFGHAKAPLIAPYGAYQSEIKREREREGRVNLIHIYKHSHMHSIKNPH